MLFADPHAVIPVNRKIIKYVIEGFGKGSKGLTVKKTDPVVGQNNQVASRISFDVVDTIVQQPIFLGKNLKIFAVNFV